jgi:hypothetical protein
LGRGVARVRRGVARRKRTMRRATAGGRRLIMARMVRICVFENEGMQRVLLYTSEDPKDVKELGSTLAENST